MEMLTQQVRASQEILRNLGAEISDEKLLQLIEKWGQDTLTLRLLGSYLVYCQKQGLPIAFPEPSCPIPSDNPLVGLNQILELFDRDLITDELLSLINTLITFCDGIPVSLVAKELLDWGIVQYDDVQMKYTMPPDIRIYYIQQRNQAIIKVLDSWFEEKDETN